MRKALITIILLSLTTTLVGQTSMSFFHLGNATYQNNEFNPAWMPDGKVFVGIPVLSGVHLHFNNKLSYNEIFTKENNQITVDIDKVLSKLQKQNMLSFQSKISILHLGAKLPNGLGISLFANERIEADFLYPRDIVDMVWNGNDGFLGEEVKIGQAGLRATHFREIGLGLSYPVNRQLDVGVRAKFLVGMLDASTPGNMKVNLTTGTSFFELEGELKKAQLRTSGVDIYDGSEGDLGSHLVMNGNTGFAFDIGAEYKLSRYYSIAGSLLDIGFISWKENIVNETLSDSTFTYSGINLDGVGDIRDALEDSLFSRFETEETNEAYTTWLPLKGYGSWIYHYDSKTDLYASIGARMIHGQLKMLYGGGVTREFGRVFTGSLSAMKMPQQFFNIGGAFTLKGGPVQFYMAADQVINFSAPDFEAFDFRFGINFIFEGRGIGSGAGGSGTAFGKGGGKNDGTVQESKGVPTNAFLGKKVKLKKRDGVYSVIPRQKKAEVDLSNPNKRKKKVNTRSLNGRTGGVKSPPRGVTKKSLTGRTGKKNKDE